jgi:hypothetical protein
VGTFLPYEGPLWLTYSGSGSLADDVFDECYLLYYPIVGEENGIIGISDDSRQQGKVYDLMGRRISQPAKGLYIINGKKMFVK